MRDPLGFLPLAVKLPLAFALLALASVAASLVADQRPQSPTPWIVGGVAVLVTAGLALVITRFVLQPLRRLCMAARAVQRGELDIALPTTSRDEIGELAIAFTDMTRTIADRQRQLGQAMQDLEHQRAAAQRQRDRLAAVVSALDDGLCILSGSGQTTLTNDSIRSFITAMDAGLLRPAECPLDGTEVGPCDHCIRFNARRGTCRVCTAERQYELRVRPIVAERFGSPERLLVCRDVTDQFRQAEIHVHQERMNVVAEMAAVVANDLNNPLAAISIFAGLLADRLPADHEARADLDVILRNADICGRAIRVLVDATAPRPRRTEVLDAGALGQAVLAFVEPLARAAGVDLCLDVAPARVSLQVSGDVEQLQQALANLVINAAQAIDTASVGSRVQLRIEAATDGQPGPHDDPGGPGRDDVIFRVIDDGPGIAPEHHERIFRPLFTTRRGDRGGGAGRGTGLGLSTSRQIVQTHGGRLSLVRSQRGHTEFAIRLPRVRAVATTPPPTAH